MKQKTPTRNLYLRIHSRARSMVKSSIKRKRQWRPSQLLLRAHFLKPHLPKMCNRLRTHYPIDWALRVDGVFIMKKNTDNNKKTCEYAGEGIEFSCGETKSVYQRYPLRLVDCCEFACCGFAHDTINLSIAPVSIALGSSDNKPITPAIARGHLLLDGQHPQ